MFSFLAFSQKKSNKMAYKYGLTLQIFLITMDFLRTPSRSLIYLSLRLRRGNHRSDA